MAIKASEVARRIGVKTGTLGKWRRQGKGPKGWYALSATVVVYPDAVWYQVKTAAEAKQIVEQHLLGDQPVEHLRLK